MSEEFIKGTDGHTDGQTEPFPELLSELKINKDTLNTIGEYFSPVLLICQRMLQTVNYFLNLFAFLLKSSSLSSYPQCWSVCLTTGLMLVLSQLQPAFTILEIRLFFHLPFSPQQLDQRWICLPSSSVLLP